MRRRWIGFAGILLGMSASVLMQTLIATALPTIESELGGMSLYGWVFGAYMLASTVTIPLFGKFADLLGHRTMYLAGLALFLAGSALAGTAHTMAQLVAFRAIQGVGAGAVAPAALAAVGDLFAESVRARVFGIIGAVQVLANLLGPAAGGWITDHFGWRWGFALVLPLGALAALFGGLGLSSGIEAEKARPPRWWRGIDWQGAGLWGAGLCIGLLGLQVVGQGAGQFLPGAAAIALAGLLFLWALLWEKRHPDPALPLALLAQPLLGRAALQTLVLGAVTNGAVAYIPLYVQGAGGATATGAGMALLPMMLAAGIAGGAGAWMGERWPRRVAGAAWLAIGIAFLSLALLRTRALPVVTGTSALIGLGMGLLLPIFLQTAQQAAGGSRLATASGTIQLARNLGGATGVPLLGVWLIGGMAIGTALSAIFASLAGAALLGLLMQLSHTPSDAAPTAEAGIRA